MDKTNKKPVFILFTTIKWDWSHTITQKIALELSRKFNVIYVNPRSELREIIKNILKIDSWKGFLKKVNNNLLVIQGPLFFPKIYRYKWFDQVFNYLFHCFVKLFTNFNAIKTKKNLIIFEPEFSEHFHYYDKYDLIYYPYDCFDKYVSKSIENKITASSPLSRCEDSLISKAKLFYTVSEKLADYFEKKYNRRPIVLPNATSKLYFLDKIDKNLEEKSIILLSGIPGKKIGYSGSIKGVLELEYIIYAAKKLPNYSFVFMGDIIKTNLKEYDQKIERLFSLNNVYHLGLQPVQLLPYLLSRMDALLMVYSAAKDVWTYYGDPAKLFEYMATGRPIFSSPHPVVDQYCDCVSIVSNYDDFVSGLNDLSFSSFLAKSESQIILARQNTWEDRIIKICEDLGL